MKIFGILFFKFKLNYNFALLKFVDYKFDFNHKLNNFIRELL